MPPNIQHPAPQFIESEAPATIPFDQRTITLTQEEQVQLKWDANYWKAQHKQLKQKNEALERTLESAQTRICD